MNQAHLNYVMVLHCHREFADTLDLKLTAKDFITVKDARLFVFSQF